MSQLDPQMREVLDAFQALGPKPNADSNLPLVGKIPIRIYTPIGDGPSPVLLYFHGGGFVIADLDVYDSSPRALANAAGCIVVSSHYRQAPEDPYPAAHDDAVAAYRWVLEHMDEIGGDGRIAIAGESAGGNLAVGVTVHARDEGMPMRLHLLLVYPIVDGDFKKPAFSEHADAKPLNTPMIAWFGKHYAPDESDPRFSVSKTDLAGLPSTTIVNAEVDPFRDDGKLLADKLSAAGVDVRHRKFDGVTHEFFGIRAAVDTARKAVEFAAARLSASLEQARVETL